MATLKKDLNIFRELHCVLGPVSQKSRNFTGHFRVSQFPLYLKNGEDLLHGFPKQAVGSFTNDFSGPKSYRDFRETGPWPQLFKRWIALSTG